MTVTSTAAASEQMSPVSAMPREPAPCLARFNPTAANVMPRITRGMSRTVSQHSARATMPSTRPAVAMPLDGRGGG
jgi:hypothetical protein